MDNNRSVIAAGQARLGIELGSTRIKAVLIDQNNTPIISGGHNWENKLENGVWTYSLDDALIGLQNCYQDICRQVLEKYGLPIKRLDAIGISGMMHGYLVFDCNNNLLVPFRTWRNTITEQASKELTQLFQYQIPQRWSIAHLYQSILENQSHVSDIAFQTTLAGYIHWRLTGQKVVGVGEASGMFPINSSTHDFDTQMMDKMNKLIQHHNLSLNLEDIFPKVLTAGQEAGQLTSEGAALLDTSGNLESGIPLCPPEGDAGTGMVATNSVREKTGNISAGTSIFAMLVLEKSLSRVYPEIDLVTTPSANPVAMVHCNNCTSDINSWVNLFGQFSQAIGHKLSTSELYDTFYHAAATGDYDCGGLLAYNYFSGEHVTGFQEGRPLLVRMPDSNFSFNNLARVSIYTALGALRYGLSLLLEKEHVSVERMLGHGGLYKTPVVGQQITADAINAPVSVMSTASEGGAWGIAVLASYMTDKTEGQSLAEYLDKNVFVNQTQETCQPNPKGVEGFNLFMKRYEEGLEIEKAATKHLILFPVQD